MYSRWQCQMSAYTHNWVN